MKKQVTDKQKKKLRVDDLQNLRIVEIEKFNTIVVIPNDSKNIQYFPLNLENYCYKTENFSQNDFPDLNKNQFIKDLEKIQKLLKESKIFDKKILNFELVLIIIFFLLAAYNNIFTFSKKNIEKKEIMPTVITGIILVILMIYKGAFFFLNKDKTSNRGKKFENLKSEVDKLISGLNDERYSHNGYEIGINKNLAFIKIKKRF